MKQFFFILFPFIYTVCFSQNELSAEIGRDQPLLNEHLKNFPDKTQLSIAIIKNSQPTYYGVIKENDSIRFTGNKDSVFEIGSITKVFTSTLLANFIVQGKIKPTATANQYFNFKFKDKSGIKLIELANHTSGIPRLPSNLVQEGYKFDNPYKHYNSNHLNEYLKNELKLLSKPGTSYEYSNTGAGLLGYILGISQKSNYSQLLQELIFDKYNMPGSFTTITGIENRVIKGLNQKGEEVSNWDFDVLTGAGGILSTAEDLTKFALAQFDPANKELALTQTPTFIINDKMKIGMGWHIIRSESGKEFHWHNGGTGGYSSSMALDVENKNGVIILSNVSPSNDGVIDKLCFELMEHLK